jgi:hypothetical protein
VRDDFTDEVKRTVAARVGSVCSNPRCGAPTSGPRDDAAKSLNVGVAAHITSASPGGPRHNAYLSPEQRRAPDNAMWLCQTCAKLVDNDASQFPETVLRAWKTLAEHEAFSYIGKARPAPAETESQRRTREILQWKGKSITLARMHTGTAVMMLGPEGGGNTVQLLDCTDFHVTGGFSDESKRSIPLANVQISYDNQRDCLKLLERYD